MFLVANWDSEEGKPDFRTGGPEGWDLTATAPAISSTAPPHHWGCCCLESDDSVCNSVDVWRIHVGKGRRIGRLQPH